VVNQHRGVFGLVARERSGLGFVSLEPDVMSVGLQWVVCLFAGAAGGFIALASVTGVGNAIRRRARARELAGDGSASPSASGLSPGSAVIGYVTQATDGADGHAGRSARAIEAICERSGWDLLEIVHDADKGPTLARVGLRAALERIASGVAHGLIVGDLQRITRSIVDLGALMAWFRDADASLVALDLDIDTSTAEGRHVADTLIALSARDHQRIASATRRGLAKGRASGRPTGRPAVSHRPDLVERIASMRAANMTLRAIADQLNAEGVPTLRGGKKWRPSSIQATLGYQRPGPRDHLPSPNARLSP
jgi:DNA invertase Pin-like site-specific DNA recombinase